MAVIAPTAGRRKYCLRGRGHRRSVGRKGELVRLPRPSGQVRATLNRNGGEPPCHWSSSTPLAPPVGRAITNGGVRQRYISWLIQRWAAAEKMADVPPEILVRIAVHTGVGPVGDTGEVASAGTEVLRNPDRLSVFGRSFSYRHLLVPPVTTVGRDRSPARQWAPDPATELRPSD